MAIFGAIGVGASGATVYRKWLDAVSDNIANISTATATSGAAYQARSVIATAMPDGQGVQVGGTALGSAEGRVVYEPDHPLADGRGYVRYPDIDLGKQMTDMMMAQRGYQANLSAVDRVREAYQAAIALGKS